MTNTIHVLGQAPREATEEEQMLLDRRHKTTVKLLRAKQKLPKRHPGRTLLRHEVHRVASIPLSILLYIEQSKGAI